jgi:hypothetical protein
MGDFSFHRRKEPLPDQILCGAIEKARTQKHDRFSQKSIEQTRRLSQLLLFLAKPE